MKGRSCLTYLLETLEAWTKALDNGYGIDAIYLGYRKAFDTVSHARLIEKLKTYGIGGRMLEWIGNFLQDRKMRVRVRSSFSDWIYVLSGVPQGSVLGPLLFLLFINDLPNWIRNNIRLFADDTKIWCIIKDKEDQQADLDEMMNWSNKWMLRFNPDKCTVMHIGHSCDTQYHMVDNGTSLNMSVTTEKKDLGVCVTNNLKPSTQCLKTANKAMVVL